jgi:alkylhydroperoxidase family enzyme
MARIEIPNGTGDPEVRMWKLRPEMGVGAGTLSHAVYEQSILAVRVRELARMRIAQINDCAICQQWRKTAGTADALTEADFEHVAEWRTYPGYSPRERLAVEYAERFALDHRAIDDDFFARLHAEYSDAEILDLTVCIGAWLALGRTMTVLGIDSYCRVTPSGPAEMPRRGPATTT